MSSRSQSTTTGPETLFQGYWRRHVRIMGVLLLVWAAVGLGAGVLFADRLNAYTLPGTGFPLGFWFAQQGSIYVFVALIFIYVKKINKIDRDFGVEEE